jgi:hypothetical protein
MGQQYQNLTFSALAGPAGTPVWFPAGLTIAQMNWNM